MFDFSTEGDKSIGQKASDTLGGSKPGEKGYVEQAQDAATNAATYVKDTANGMSTLCAAVAGHTQSWYWQLFLDLYNKASDATSGNK